MTATSKPRKITATAENGQIFARKTARNYTHAVYIEITYSDGTVENADPRWAGRPDLMEKTLKKTRESSARLQGTEVGNWDHVNQASAGAGIFREKVRAIAVPVDT